MLYIMRHGKTDWNARCKLQGRADIPLNQEGREMAAAARAQYQNIHFDVCYCSPLVRAKETAEIFLQGRDIEIIPDERLKEMNFGIYEGTEHSFQIPDCPVNVLFFDPANYKGVEGGETLEELCARTGSFLKELAEPAVKSGKNVLVVAHGALNCSIICHVQNLSMEHFWDTSVENCKLLSFPEWCAEVN